MQRGGCDARIVDGGSVTLWGGYKSKEKVKQRESKENIHSESHGATATSLRSFEQGEQGPLGYRGGEMLWDG